MLSPNQVDCTDGAISRPISITPPPVVDLAAITDPVQRNQAINQSYHAFDSAMVRYTGNPLVSNWFTYGQHASREAGAQIRNLQAGLATLNDVLIILTNLARSPNPITVIREAIRAGQALSRIVELLQQPGLLQQGLQLALMKAGITVEELTEAARHVEDMATFDATDLIPGKAAYEALVVAKDIVSLGGRLAIALPSIITALRRVYDNMCQGNREIYENIAPACRDFLLAASASPTGVPGAVPFTGDPSGYVSAAFRKYGEVKAMSDALACTDPASPEYAQKKSLRDQTAHQANLLIGYQEQLVILQPIFDTMQEELEAMSGTMVLNDPNGVHELAGGWGDFYTRMGIDSTQAPQDPTAITPGNLPPLLDGSDPAYQGTIAEYFEDGLTDRNIHNALPSIEPL
jgi:hypothetical protein